MPGDFREREDMLHAFLFAKALPSLSGFTVDQQRVLIRDAWITADRTMELVRDEAQLRMRPIVERHLRPHEKSAPPVGGEQVPEAATLGNDDPSLVVASSAPAHGEPGSTRFRRCRSCMQEISHLAPGEHYCLRHRGDGDA